MKLKMIGASRVLSAATFLACSASASADVVRSIPGFGKPLSRTLSGWLDISPVSDSNPSPGELFYMFYEQINRPRADK